MLKSDQKKGIGGVSFHRLPYSNVVICTYLLARAGQGKETGTPRIIYSSGPPSPWQLSMCKFSVPMAFLWTS